MALDIALSSMKRVGIYFLLALAVMVMLSSVGPIQEYWRISSRGVRTVGTVVKLTCGNHQTFGYEFAIEGRPFQAIGRHAEKPCEALAVGDQVAVFYLPNEPTTSMVGNPQAELDNEVISIAMAALVFPGLAMWAYSRRAKKVAA